METWHFGRLAGVRAGVNSDYFSAGLSCRYAWVDAAVSMQLDYTYTYPWRLADTSGSHWVGMTLGWDRLNPREEEKKQDLARKLQSAQRARGIVKDALQSSQQTLNDVRQALTVGGPEVLPKATQALEKINDAAETANLAAEVVQTVAMEARSTTISGMAEASAQEASLIRQFKVEVDSLYNSAQAQALLVQAAAREAVPAPVPTLAMVPLPEKYSDRIVLGIETKVITDFDSYRVMEPMLKNFAVDLQTAIGMKLEYRLLSPAEILLALHQGELDGVIAYETNLEKYLGPGRLEPKLTVQKGGKIEQSCGLYVRADSPIKTLAQAKGKCLGYSNASIASRLDTLFFDPTAAPNKYFFSMEKQKNARDSLWALQLETVDVVAEYAYLEDVAKLIPIQVRKIAESEPAPNAPLFMRTSQYPAKKIAMQKLVMLLLRSNQEPDAMPLYKVFKLEKIIKYNAVE